MALDGEDFQAGKLTTLPFHISSKVAPLLGGVSRPEFPKMELSRRPHFFLTSIYWNHHLTERPRANLENKGVS